MKRNIMKYVKLLSLLGLAFFIIFCLYNENFYTKTKSFNLYIGNYKESKEPNSNAELKNERDSKYKAKLLESLSESKDIFNQAQTEMSNKNYNKAILLLNKVTPIDKENYGTAQKLLNTCKGKISKSALLSNTKVFIENKVNYSNIKIPILMFHSITNVNGNSLQLSKEDFYQQMKYIKENGYTPINLDDLYDFLSGKRKAPQKPITITFDDGYEDNYTNAYPILKEFGFKATIFAITNEIDKNNAYINSNQIHEMSNYGISVESHTTNHNNLASLSYKAQYEILKKAREDLEGIEGRKIKYLAYPSGRYNSFTEKAAKDSGYIMAVTTKPGFASEANGYLFLHRVRVNSGRSLDVFIKSIIE